MQTSRVTLDLAVYELAILDKACKDYLWNVVFDDTDLEEDSPFTLEDVQVLSDRLQTRRTQVETMLWAYKLDEIRSGNEPKALPPAPKVKYYPEKAGPA